MIDYTMKSHTVEMNVRLIEVDPERTNGYIVRLECYLPGQAMPVFDSCYDTWERAHQGASMIFAQYVEGDMKKRLTEVTDAKAKAIILAVFEHLNLRDIQSAMMVDRLELDRYEGSGINHELRNAEQERLMATIDTKHLQPALKKILEGKS